MHIYTYIYIYIYIYIQIPLRLTFFKSLLLHSCNYLPDILIVVNVVINEEMK